MPFTSPEKESSHQPARGEQRRMQFTALKTKAAINQHVRGYKHKGAETRTSNTATENKRKCDIRHAPVTAKKQQVNEQIDELK